MIEARSLTKRYGDTVAVDDLSFTVPAGQVTGFVGPNGAGKSTTLRMIVGLDSPTAGSVSVNGRPYATYTRPACQVGALLDASATHGGRSAYNHLLCLGVSNGIPKHRVAEVLDQVGLASVARKRVGGFSLGMAQRLGIAAALLGDPPVLLFDEPVNGLDPEGVRWIRNLLTSLAAEGRTVLLSSHLMSEMAITADRLIIIGRGHLLAETTVEDFLAHAAGTYVQVRSPHSAGLVRLIGARGGVVEPQPDGVLHIRGISRDAVGEIASANGITLLELAVHEPSLEETYMELTRDAVDYHTRDDMPIVGADTGR
jgi:ABC-2 type transport system ATP-binding protein